MTKNVLYLTIATLLLLSIVLVGTVSAAPKPKLATPTPVMPVNYEDLINTATTGITFQWNSVAGAEAYQLDLQKCEASYLNCVYEYTSQGQTGNTFNYNWVANGAGSTGRWRVSALLLNKKGSITYISQPSDWRYFNVRS